MRPAGRCGAALKGISMTGGQAAPYVAIGSHREHISTRAPMPEAPVWKSTDPGSTL